MSDRDKPVGGPMETGESMTRTDKAEVVRQATASVKWATLGALLPRLVTPISTMILAAILTPADFGVVAISAVVIAFAQVVVGLGLAPAVVQRRTLVLEAASAAFWLSLTAAISLYGLIWVTSPWLATVYRLPIVSQVVRVSGLSLVFYALGAIPAALLQRKLEFRKLFWVDSLAQASSVVVSLVLAFEGFGVWALVIGPLSGAAVRAVLACSLAGWAPRPWIDRAVVSQLVGFSLWMVASGFLAWLSLYGDNAIGGYFFGSASLGVYALGCNISNLIPGLVVPAISAIAYPAFCALQADRREVGRSLLGLQSLAAAVLFPVCFGLSAVATPGVFLLYGSKWHGLGPVIHWLAIMPGLSHLWSLNADALRAVGRPDLWVKIAALTLVGLVGGLLLVGRYGLIQFTFVRFGAGMLYVVLTSVIGGRVLGVSVRQEISVLFKPFLCATTMYAGALLLTRLLQPFQGITGAVKMSLLIVTSALGYFVILRQADRGLWNRLLAGARQVVAAR